MKSAILACVVAAGVGGIASSSYAQEVKKLPPHPAAAADPSLQHRAVELPSTTSSHPGAAGAPVAKPTTGDPVPSGGKSTAQSKQRN
jgi:hypothetical protein